MEVRIVVGVGTGTISETAPVRLRAFVSVVPLVEEIASEGTAERKQAHRPTGANGVWRQSLSVEPDAGLVDPQRSWWFDGFEVRDQARIVCGLDRYAPHSAGNNE